MANAFDKLAKKQKAEKEQGKFLAKRIKRDMLCEEAVELFTWYTNRDHTDPKGMYRVRLARKLKDIDLFLLTVDLRSMPRILEYEVEQRFKPKKPKKRPPNASGPVFDFFEEDDDLPF